MLIPQQRKGKFGLVQNEGSINESSITLLDGLAQEGESSKKIEKITSEVTKLWTIIASWKSLGFERIDLCTYQLEG